MTEEKELLQELDMHTLEAPEPEEETAEDVVETPEETPEEEVEEQEQSDRERNLAALREKTKQAERERDEAIGYIRQLQQMQQQNQNVPAETQNNTATLPEFGDEDLIEGKHLKRERERYNKELQEIRKEFSQYKQQNTQSQLETKLKTQYPDIEDVLTIDNVNAFREANPRLAQALAYSPDPYAQAVETYNQIKALGVYKKDTYTEEKKRIQKNAIKPRSTASISPQQSDSPLTRAGAFSDELTPERKSQLYKEMQEKARSWE